jgi:hypothetical protein
VIGATKNEGIEMIKAKIHENDIYELAAYLTQTTEQYEKDGDDSLVEDALIDQFEIDIDSLHRLVEILMPMITVSRSDLQEGVIYRGFADRTLGMYLVKMDESK